MAAQHVSDSGSAVLREVLERTGLSRRELGRRLGVSHVAVTRWERGERSLPDHHRSALAALDADGLDHARDVVRAQPGIGEEALLAQLTPAERRVVRRAIASGELIVVPTERPDGRGRVHSRRGVFLAGDGPPPPEVLEPSGLDGATLRRRRRELGWTVDELAGRVGDGIAGSTVRRWENGLRPISRARAGQLSEVLSWPCPEDVRRVRKAAGWSLEQLARRVGVHLTVIDAWERRKHPIPAGRLPALRAALAEASAAPAPDELERRRSQLVDYARTHPDSTRSVLLHAFRERKGGAHVASPRTGQALEEAIRRGELVESGPAGRGPDGGLRKARVLNVPGIATRSPLVGELTGADLAKRRKAQGLSQRELAELVDVERLSGTMIGWYERRPRDPIPTELVAPLLEVLAECPDPIRDARLRIIEAIAGDPGISRWLLHQTVGGGKSEKAARRQLESEGQIEAVETFNRLGRPYSGLYYRRPGTKGPVQHAPERMTAPQLRSLLARSGWRQAQLAGELGVATNTVSRWCSGARGITPDRAVEIRRTLSRPAPSDRRAEARSEARTVRLLRHVRAGGAAGVPPASLTPMFGTTARAHEVLERAIAAGSVHVAEHIVSDRSGRPYLRRRVLFGAAPAGRLHLSGAELRDARNAAGLSQGELGRRLGVSQGLVSRWELDTVPPGHVDAVRAALSR